jgi:hypothetical protein
MYSRSKKLLWPMTFRFGRFQIISKIAVKPMRDKLISL